MSSANSDFRGPNVRGSGSVNLSVNIDGKDKIKELTSELSISRKECETLKGTIDELKGSISSMKNEMSNSGSIQFVNQLKEQLEQAEYQLQRFRNKAVSELDFMLSASHLDLYGSDSYYSSNIREAYDNLVEGIRTGNRTAIEAMTQLKSDFADVWSQVTGGASGSNIDSAVFYQMASSIQDISGALSGVTTQLTDVILKINSIITDGVAVSGVAAESTDGIASSMQRASSAGADLKKTFESLQQVINGFNATEKEAYQSITEFVQSVAQVGNLDADRLESLRQQFRSIASISENKLPNFNGLKTFLENLNSAPDASKIQALSSLNLQGLSGISISGKSLESLATNLPKIASANMDALERLSKLDWTKLASLKSTKENVFEGLNKLSAKSVDNLNNLSKLKWDKLSELKINKSAVDNLNAISITEKKVATLQSLASIDWSNLTNFSMSKSTTENILALSNIKDQLETLHRQVSSGGGGNGGGGVKNMIADANNYNSAMGELVRTTEEVSTATGELTRSQLDYENAVTKTKTSIKGSSIVTVVDEKALAKEKMAAEDIAAALAKVDDARNKLSSKISTANSISGILGPVNGVDALESAINSLSLLRDQLSTGTMTNSQFADEFNKIKSAADVATKSIDAQAISAKRLEEVNKQLEESNRREANSVKERQNSDSSYLTSLRNLLNLQQQLYKYNGAENVNGGQTNTFQMLSAAIDVLDQSYRNVATDGAEQFNVQVRNTGNVAKQAAMQIDALKDASNQIANIDKLTTSLSKIDGGDVTSLNKYREDITALIDLLNSGGINVRQFNEELNKLSAQYSSATNAAQDFINANKGSSNSNPFDALEKKASGYIAKLKGMQAQLQNVIGGTSSSQYADVIAALDKLNNVDKTNLVAFTSVLKEVGESLDALKKNADAFANGVKASAKDVASEFNKIDSGAKKLEQTLTNAGVSNSSEEYNLLTERLRALKAEIDNIRNSKGTNGYDEAAVAKLRSEYESLFSAITQYSAAMRKAATEERNKEAETRRAASAMKELQNIQQSTSKFLQQSTMASTGKTSANYAAIQSELVALEKLRNQYLANQIAPKKFATAVAESTSRIRQNQQAIIDAGEATMSFGDKVKKVAANFSYFFSTTRLIMTAVRQIKQMFSYANEIDSALAQLKIVTGATNAEMEKFSETAVNLAKDLGKPVTDLTKTIETFSRLGYTLAESSELSKFATILSNVASVNVDEATTGLTSIVKGFGLEYNDVEHVADVLVEVGQKYAVSASEIMEAFEKSSAALSATGVSLEQSAGLIAAGKIACPMCA